MNIKKSNFFNFPKGDIKKSFLFVVFLLAVFSLSKIRFLEDNIMYGEDLEIFTNVVNNGDKDQDDVRVVALFPELGETVNTQRFDVQDNDNNFQLMWWNVPKNVPKGDYLVRIAVSNDNVRTHKFRYITVE
jgi:hypothetical protein